MSFCVFLITATEILFSPQTSDPGKVMNVIYHATAVQGLVQATKTELNEWTEYEYDDKFNSTVCGSLLLWQPFSAASFLFSRRSWLTKCGFYDLNNPTLFWTSITYQHIATVLGSSTNAFLEIIPVLFMVYIIAMLEQLCDEVEMLKKPQKGAKRECWQRDTTDSESHRSKLIKIIEKHRNLLEITRKFERIFSLTFFVRGLASTVVFAPLHFR